MKVQYRKSFLKDLKRLKGQSVYNKVFELAFSTLPKIESLKELPNVISMKGYSNRSHAALPTVFVSVGLVLG